MFWKVDDVFESILKKEKSDIPCIVQVGANDGKSNDPIFKHLQKIKCKAFFVEPQPDVYKKLVENYKDAISYKNFVFINNAISNTNENIKMYRIAHNKLEEYKKIYKKDANASGITSMDRKHVEDFLYKIAPDFFKNEDIYNWIEQIEVPPIGFDKVVSKYDIKCIDILQIDTEGYDYEILKLVFATGIYPVVINMEYKNISNKSQYELIETLQKNNYNYVEHNGDLLAAKKDIIKLSPWAFKLNILAKKIIRRLSAK